MSKQSLNLSVEESIKKRAKRIARERGVSVSRFFEELVAREETPNEYTPKPGSAAYKLANLIPESKKRENYNYDQMRHEALKEKYDL